jgi:outer membrane protein W
MKRTINYFWILIVSVSLCGNVLAQDWYGAATYQISFPAGDTKDFTNATSFRGVGLDFRMALDKNITWGLFFGWNVFYERVNETVQIENENPGAITSTQDRTLNSFPMMLTGHYYFGEKKGFRPYAGLGLGGFVMGQRLDIGIHTFSSSQWEWGIAPEIGFVWPVDYDFSIIVNGKYNYAFTGELPTGKKINHSYLNLNIGIVWGPGW